MNKKEFASRIRIRDKKFYRVLFAGMTAVGIWMLSAPFLDHFYKFNEPKSVTLAWGIFGIAAILAVMMVLAFFGSQRGMPCPHCKKRLFGIPGQIAVATGNCGFCGEKVFEG